MESYIRDGRGSMLIIRAEGVDEPSYQMEMLRKSRPDRLLPVQICAINDQREYHYEAGGLTPLSEFLEKRTIGFGMLQQFLDSIKGVLSSVEEYLLEADRLCLEPEHIYTEEKEHKLWFCYGPQMQGIFEKGLLKLLQFFLEKLDYEDKRGVTLAYQIYQNVMKEGYHSVFAWRIIDDQHEQPEVVFPWEEEEERKREESEEVPKRQPQRQSEQREPGYRQGQRESGVRQPGQKVASQREPGQRQSGQRRQGQGQPEQNRRQGQKPEQKKLESVQLGIYAAGGIVCGAAAGICYWQKNLMVSGGAILAAAVIFCLLIYFGRQYKGIDSSGNT